MGETDNIQQRLKKHRQVSRGAGAPRLLDACNAVVAQVSDKSAARHIEAVLINQLRSNGYFLTNE